MNPKLKKLIEDVAKVNAEAARYIELEAPKLKSYKIWEVLRLSSLFDWAESPQRNGYWFDIDEKIIMLAKGQPAGKYSTDHKESEKPSAASLGIDEALDEIEAKICSNELTASQVFTQMRQLINREAFDTISVCAEAVRSQAASSSRVPFSEAAVVCGDCGFTAKIEMFAILKGRDIKGQRVCPGCGRHNSII